MKDKRRLAFLVIGVFLVMLGYIGVSQATQAIGYPLDDAWIHQTYARNLAQWGEWAFIRGQFSAGSTAPLWTFLLSIGYLMHLNHFVWTLFLGGLCLAGIALLGWRIIGDRGYSTWFAFFLIGEWHLIWSALSGMETLLFSVLILSVFYLCNQNRFNSWLIGLLVGLSIWVRPDGITLLGPIIFIILFQPGTKRDKTVSILKVFGGFLGAFIPYLAFNGLIAGTFLPNTFFAKQSEYAILQNEPILLRAATLMGLPLVGAGVILLPGFIFAGLSFLREKNQWGIAAILWWAGFTLIYALRLPVTYQHGRYLIPAMPVFWLIGWIGSVKLLERLRGKKDRLFRLVRFGAVAALILIWIIFGVLGAQTYAVDVAIINTEMVATAQWIEANTPEGATIGAHDIGALGFFANRKIIDLAGLISPEVIPFIRNEQRLLSYLEEHQASYLMSFPNWYPWISQKLPLVFSTQGKFSPAAGGENMAVYTLHK